MDWGSILGTTAAAASGGIFGVLGSAVGTVAKYFQAKQEHKQKVELTRLEMEVAAQKGSWDGLTASQTAEASIGNTYHWVNAARGLFRPMLTVLLLICTMVIFKDIMGGTSKLAEIFDAGELKDILRYIVYSIVFTTASAAMWWFGDRAMQPKGMKNL